MLVSMAMDLMSHYLFAGDSLPEETVLPPQDLVTSDVTAHSFRVSWTHTPSNVEKYRVVYYPTSGGRPEEVTNHELAQ